MKTLLSLLLLAIWSAPVSADCKLSWTCPTTRVDGSAFNCADVTGWRVRITPPGGTASEALPLLAPETRALTRPDPAGTKYQIRVHAGSLFSALSNEGVCPQSPPSAPVLTVTVQ